MPHSPDKCSYWSLPISRCLPTIIYIEKSQYCCVIREVTKYPSLNRQECEELLRCLEMGLAVFGPKSTPLSASELQLKSMLSVLRSEVRNHYENTYASGPLEHPSR